MKSLMMRMAALAVWLAAVGMGGSTASGAGQAGRHFPGLDPGDLDFGDGPMLLAAIPSDGESGVATATSLQWIFSTAMAPSQAVQWSANVDPSKVVYTWGFGNQFLTVSYTGGWPGNATVSYVLNPPGTSAGFKSATGESLPATSGSFATAAGGGGGNPDGCQPGGGSAAGSFFMAKSFTHHQTSDASPPLAVSDEGSALFFATVTSPTNATIVEATLRLPSGSSVVISNIFGTFIHSAAFQTQAQLDAAYPGGSYTLTVRYQNGSTQTGTLNYPANAAVSVPRLANYGQLAGFAAAQSFTFRWDAFAGAAAPNDYLSFSATDAKGTSFSAPDLCVPRELPVTATSILLPANTLSANLGNSGRLTFSRTVAQNASFTASLSMMATISRETSFDFAGSVAPPVAPEFKGIERSPAGVVTVRIALSAGAAYNVQFSTDLKAWQTVHTATAASALETVTHTPAAGMRAGFYRAAVLP